MHVTPMNMKPLAAVGKFKSTKLKVLKQRLKRSQMCSQQKAKHSVELSSVFSLHSSVKSHGSEGKKEEKRKALEKRESLTPEKRNQARNPAGFSNFSNLRARRRASRPRKKQEPEPFRLTMKKLQDLEISQCQTKAIGKEEVSLFYKNKRMIFVSIFGQTSEP